MVDTWYGRGGGGGGVVAPGEVDVGGATLVVASGRGRLGSVAADRFAVAAAEHPVATNATAAAANQPTFTVISWPLRRREERVHGPRAWS